MYTILGIISGFILGWWLVKAINEGKWKNPTRTVETLLVLKDAREEKKYINLLEDIEEFKYYDYISIDKITNYEYGKQISSKTVLTKRDYSMGYDDGFWE